MPTAAGFFGAFSPEATNITASQQEMYQRSLDRQKQLEEAMRNALENRRLEAQVSMDKARQALEERRLTFEEQQISRRKLVQSITDPTGTVWDVYQNPDGTVSREPSTLKLPTDFDARLGEIRQFVPGYQPGDPIDPKVEKQLEEFGTLKAPSGRLNDAERVAQYMEIISHTPHPGGGQWTEPELYQKALEYTNRIAAAEAGIYTSRPTAGRSRADQLAGSMTVGQKREWDIRTARDRQAIQEAVKAKERSDAMVNSTSAVDPERAKGYKTNSENLQKIIDDAWDRINAVGEQMLKESGSPIPPAGGQPTGTPISQGGPLPQIPQPIRSPLLQGPGDTGQITQADLDRYLAQASQGQQLPPEVAALLKQGGMDVHVEEPYTPSPLQLKSPAITPGPGGYGAGLQPPPMGGEEPAAPPHAAKPAQAPYLSAQRRPAGFGKKWSVSQWQRQNKNPNIKVWEAARQAAAEGYQVVP